MGEKKSIWHDFNNSPFGGGKKEKAEKLLKDLSFHAST